MEKKKIQKAITTKNTPKTKKHTFRGRTAS